MHPRNITYGKLGGLTVPRQTYAAFRQMYPEGNSRPYKILETYETSEGSRSRICSGNYASIDDAIAAIERKRAPFVKCKDRDCSDYRNINGGCTLCGAPCL